MGRPKRHRVTVDPGQFVRVRCRHGLDDEEGWIVAAGRKWLLLQREWDAGVDGWVAIRRNEVRRVKRLDQRLHVVTLKLAAEVPRSLAGLNLERTTALLVTAQDIVRSLASLSDGTTIFG